MIEIGTQCISTRHVRTFYKRKEHSAKYILTVEYEDGICITLSDSDADIINNGYYALKKCLMKEESV